MYFKYYFNSCKLTSQAIENVRLVQSNNEAMLNKFEAMENLNSIVFAKRCALGLKRLGKITSNTKLVLIKSTDMTKKR